MSKFFKIYLAVWLMVLSSSVLAKYETLDNGIVKFSVNDAGTIGLGDDGINTKRAHGDWLRFQGTDYLTQGIPFEMFSLKIDGVLFANDNAGSAIGKKRWSQNNGIVRNRTNDLNIQSMLSTDHNTSINAITIKENIFEIQHKYILNGNQIQIHVNVTNQSSNPSKFIYTRGIDMDPGGTKSKVERGGRNGVLIIRPEDFIYSINSDTNTFPLTMFTQENIPHNTYVLDFLEPQLAVGNPYCPGCVYDPDMIAQHSLPSINGDKDAVIYMTFDLGYIQPNESKSFVFYYIFGKDIPDVIKNLPVVSKTKISGGSIKIKYKNTINYENVSTNSLVVNQVGGDPDKYLHKAFLKWSVGMMSSLPDGFKLEINGHSLSKNQKQIPFEFYYNKPIKFKILRNKDFRLPSEKTIELEVILDKKIVDKKEIQEKGELNTVKLTIKPIKRAITFKTNSPNNKTSILDLKNSEALEIEIFADGESIIDPEELKKFKLDIDVEGINYKLTKNENTHKVSLKLLPEFPLCRTQTGDININITVDEGFYPHDEGSYVLKYHIEDATFWEKCKEFIIGVLIALLILWYLFGLIRRNKFCKRQAIVKEGVKDDDGFVLRRDSSYNLKKRVKFLQKLIPYRADRVKLDGIIYIASESCSSVYIAKNSQSSLKIDYQEIDKPGTKLKKIFNGTSLQDGQNNYILK